MGYLARVLPSQLSPEPHEFPVLNKVKKLRTDIPVPYEMLQDIQTRMMKQIGRPRGGDQTAHMWCKGLYSRQFFQPAGQVLVSLTHKNQNFFFMLQGHCFIGTPEGTAEVEAPYMTVTQPGTKRIIYAVTDCVYVTVHANPDNETDLIKLEDLLIIPEPGVPRDLSIQQSTRKIFT